MKKETRGDETKKIDLMEFVKKNEKNILELFEINEIKGGDGNDGDICPRTRMTVYP